MVQRRPSGVVAIETFGRTRMGLSRRRADFTIAAAIVAVAVVVSPIGIRLATGRLDLSSQINVLSLTFVLFLLILAGAGLTWGRARMRLSTCWRGLFRWCCWRQSRSAP